MNRYKTLNRLLKRLRPQIVLEIGTWNGNRAIEMCRAAGTDKYIGFDLFENADEETDKRENNVKAHYSHDTVSQLLKNAGLNFQLFKGDTRETLKDVDIQVDFAFIDGGHSIETIENDWLNVKDMVKPGGHIVLDDYYRECPEEYIDRFGCNRVLEKYDVPFELLEGLDRFKSAIGDVEGGVCMVLVRL